MSVGVRIPDGEDTAVLKLDGAGVAEIVIRCLGNERTCLPGRTFIIARQNVDAVGGFSVTERGDQLAAAVAHDVRGGTDAI